jgi:CTP:molybdopterin cytidylyltransferase MocA
MNVLILAGATSKPDFFEAAGVSNPALAELAPGKSMLGLIVDAVRSSESAEGIWVIGKVPTTSGYTTLPPGQTLIDNLLHGLAAMPESVDGYTLLVSSDIPFVTAAALDAFAASAKQCGADIVYPIISVDKCKEQFPGMRRTALKLREGHFTGGNVFAVRPSVIAPNAELIRAAHAARKSVARLGAMLGWATLARVVASQLIMPSLLDVCRLEMAVQRLLGGGISVKAVEVNDASVGADVDRPGDLAEARRVFAERS